MGPTRLVVPAFLALIASVPSAAQSGPDAKTQATTYLEAFLHGKPAVAARLTHPTVLASQRQALMKGYEEAAKTGTQREYLESLGLSLTRAELDALTDEGCFVAFAEGNQRRNPEAFKAMKKARISLLEGTLLADQRYQAVFRVEAPSGKTTSLQRMMVLLEMTPAGWRVLAVSS